MVPLISCDSVFWRPAHEPLLRDCSLQVMEGTHVVLTGPSGAGKTSLLRIIAGLVPPQEGRVIISGKDASKRDEIMIRPSHRGIGMVFQDLGLWPGLTVLGNIRLALSGSGLPHNERHARAVHAIEACRLGGLEKRLPAQLSGGEQQRAAIARALAVRPKCLLLDEPFAALDLSLRRELWDLLRQLKRDNNWTMITVTHQPHDAWGMEADSVAVLEDGCFKEVFAPTEVFDEGSSTTRRLWQQFLREMPLLTNERGSSSTVRQ